MVEAAHSPPNGEGILSRFSPAGRRDFHEPQSYPFGFEAAPSQPQPELPPQIPLDASVTAHNAGDVSADALVEHRLPRHQAEPEPVFDHGVAPADEIGRAGKRTADVPRHLGGVEGHAARLRHLPPDPLDLLTLQSGDEVPLQEEGSVRQALGVAGLDQPFGAPVECRRYVPTETGLDEWRARAGDQFPVEPGGAIAANLPFEVEGRKGADLQTVATPAEVMGPAPIDDVLGDPPVVLVDPHHMAGTAQRLQAAHVKAHEGLGVLALALEAVANE